jgi:hypothetical protein
VSAEQRNKNLPIIPLRLTRETALCHTFVTTDALAIALPKIGRLRPLQRLTGLQNKAIMKAPTAIDTYPIPVL